MDIGYILYSVVIEKNKVIRKPVLNVEYDYAVAVKCIKELEIGRDQTAKFGTFSNPLRYEAANVGGTIEI